MSGRSSFDDALDVALDSLLAGGAAPSVSATHQEHAGELAHLLVVAAGVRDAAAAAPAPSMRLAGHARAVRLAVRDAQAGARRRRAWWRRPMTFASLSLPAGIVALAAIGAAGAAAGGAVAVSQTGVASRVERIVTLGRVGGSDAPPPVATPAGGSDRSGGAAGGPTAVRDSNGGGVASQGTPENPNAPVTITVSGVIREINGGTFTLETESATWKVNHDGTTVITDTIAEGAFATVTGTATADRNLHAARIDVAGGGSPPAGATGVVPGAAATPSPADGRPGGNPGHTPGTGNDTGTPRAGGVDGTSKPGNGNGTPPKTPADGNGNSRSNAPPGNGNGLGNGNGGGRSQTP
ncbi:MAG: hypothetical protein IVW36_08925 [Dehalococcoidia bacterium]|nr:hypothetical protein [Dehalococcoidia bacterium]